MDRKLIEKYKRELIRNYHGAVPVNAYINGTMPNGSMNSNNLASNNQTRPMNPSGNMDNASPEHQGKLIVTVSSVNGLYPVPGALVTVYTGDYRTNMHVVATETTDNNGLTRPIPLETVAKSNSMTSGSSLPPFTAYNLLIESDGYLNNIHLNIPIFEDITSLQRSNLILTATAGENKNPQIFDESKSFNL